MRFVTTFLLLTITLAACQLSTGTSSSVAEDSNPMPNPVSTRQMPIREESWLRLTEVPANATQAEKGSEIYRLVCSTCHGDVGQGLTEEWLSTIDENTRNCWQSKCHAPNHPPEGFILPRYVPPLVGSSVSTRFDTAYDLFTFIRTYMPYQAPGSLTETEYWQLAAFILDLNSYNLENLVLDAETASTYELN